ncbi:MAG: rhodanese-like domain-containing protein [Bacteroidetes bacterium]|nr:rhodanese-like domain-containing protein [Bacteroidota bacterium]
MNLERIINQQNAKIIDVRTPAEFHGFNAPGSINIPLNEIPDRVEELKQLNVPIVLCCASGNRSGQAHHYLTQHGIECYNGGSWLDVNFYLANK